MNIREINSQVNEQANAGLQRIRGQLAYMTAENFMFTVSLFLYLKNQDKTKNPTSSNIQDLAHLHI